MGPVDRVARAAVRAAARRWPDDLAPTLRDEWLAELAAVAGPRRAYRKLAFAASLAVSPAVDEPSWRERAGAVGRAAAVAAGVTLLAAVATNVARGSGAPALLLPAVAGLIVAGRRVRGSVALVGVALFAFLFAGNPVPMMPFLGAADIAPLIAVWVAGIALALRLRRRWAVAAAGLVTLDLATIAGSAHAAAVLGVPAWTAPAWFPLALLPGDVVSFGPLFGDGTAAFGGLRASGPAFHASEILAANAAVSAGPLLLCTAFLLAPALRRGPVPRPRPAATSGVVRRLGTDAGRTLAGLSAALVALAVAPALPTAGADADAALRRMLDNSTAFGFGFVEHPAGLGAVALLAAVLAMRAVDRRPG
ncbi:hypothetical protein [Actinoplanes sp. M2I2]|uniref:hypothetical protein n=1 Tax=Actinoplanes sp. M2I2 TaxID=1734444 RepID=UPI002020E5F5|nr:hypothetical protein [Actinoplanes sp. M2I2]